MDQFFQILIAIFSFGIFFLILVGFWLYGYRYLKKRNDPRAKIQLWLGPLLGFFTGVILFQTAIFHREVQPLAAHEPLSDKDFTPDKFLSGVLNFLIQVGFTRIQNSESLNNPVYYRKVRHLMVMFKEYYQFVDWDQSGQDPLWIVKQHQLFRSWVDQQIKIPKIMRGTVPVVVTYLITGDGLDDDSSPWIRDELAVYSSKDWAGGEVQSILVIDRKNRTVESLKAQKQGDTIGLNHALDLVQGYLNTYPTDK